MNDRGHHEIVLSDVLATTEDIWITGMEFALENAPSSVLHHAQLIDLDSLSKTCGHAGTPANLYNLGEDTLHTKSVFFEEPYGLFVPKGHRLLLQSMFHNPEPPIGTGEDYYNVSASLNLSYEYAQNSERSRPLEYYFMHLDDELCNPKTTFSVPANTMGFTKTADESLNQNPAVVTFDTSGEIRYIGGHLHGWEGGKFVDFLLNGKMIRRFEITPSSIPGMKWETPQGPDSIKIVRGDTVSLSAVYDNPGKDTMEGAMGIVGFYFAPE